MFSNITNLSFLTGLPGDLLHNTATFLCVTDLANLCLASLQQSTCSPLESEILFELLFKSDVLKSFYQKLPPHSTVPLHHVFSSLRSFRCLWCCAPAEHIAVLFGERVCEKCYFKMPRYKMFPLSLAGSLWNICSSSLISGLPYVLPSDPEKETGASHAHSRECEPHFSAYHLHKYVERNCIEMNQMVTRRTKHEVMDMQEDDEGSRDSFTSTSTVGMLQGSWDLLSLSDVQRSIDQRDARQHGLVFVGFKLSWFFGHQQQRFAIVIPISLHQYKFEDNLCFKTIGSAISASESGTTIIILEGEYIEDIEIDKSLRLLGQGSVRITSNKSVAVDVLSGDCVIENISLSQMGNPFFCISARGSDTSITLTRCNIFSECKTCVAVYQGAEAYLEDCHIHGPCAYAGVAVFESSKACIVNCEVSMCCTWAIQVDASSEAHIERNFLHHCCVIFGTGEYPILNERTGGTNIVDIDNTIADCGVYTSWGAELIMLYHDNMSYLA